MITPREMKQLFHAISSMHTVGVNDIDHIDKLAVLKILSGYCEEYPAITFKRLADGKTEWNLKWPIPLTDIADETEGPVP